MKERGRISCIGLPPNLRDEESDSGWQLWAREDDDAYVADRDNLVLWSLGWITDKFPAITPLFTSDEEAGQWWWDDEARAYQRRA